MDMTYKKLMIVQAICKIRAAIEQLDPATGFAAAAKDEHLFAFLHQTQQALNAKIAEYIKEQ